MRIYRVQLVSVSVSGAISLVQVKAGATVAVELLRAWVSAEGTISAAMQPVQIVRKTVAATVTAQTPLLFQPGDSAAASVGGTAACGFNASSEGTDGDVLYRDSFNIVDGWLWLPVQEERIIVPPAGIIAVKFPSAPAAAFNCNAGLLFGEIG